MSQASNRLIEKYQAAIDAKDIVDNPSQRLLLLGLNNLLESLNKAEKSWFACLRPKTIIKGYYIYGAVGVGKTYIMDLFYNQVPGHKKKRFHFYHFMQEIDAKLRALQGQKNPLKRIAKDLAASTKLLCFDEFMVEEVAHAMILKELLQALLDQGLILVATSNIAPDALYLKGLHRERFLAAILSIKAHCVVAKLQDAPDHRLGRSLAIAAYLYPLEGQRLQQFLEQFIALAPKARIEPAYLSLQGREFLYQACHDLIIWFDFKVICNLPRCASDYLEISKRFDTVFISNIPQLGENDTVYVFLFIALVDIFYDRGIRLIILAAVALEQLYLQGEMQQDFKRTLSRLHEMQSLDYQRRHPRRLEEDFL